MYLRMQPHPEVCHLSFTDMCMRKRIWNALAPSTGESEFCLNLSFADPSHTDHTHIYTLSNIILFFVGFESAALVFIFLIYFSMEHFIDTEVTETAIPLFCHMMAVQTTLTKKGFSTNQSNISDHFLILVHWNARKTTTTITTTSNCKINSTCCDTTCCVIIRAFS